MTSTWGRIRVLHAFPHSRLDIVVGKLCSRSGIVALAITAALAVSATAYAGLYSTLPVAEFVLFGAMTVLLAVTFTTIGVGVSSAVATRGRAMVGAIGSYTVLATGREPLVSGLYYALHGSLPGLNAPGWYFLLRRVNPLTAYRTGVNSFLGLTSPQVPSVNPLPIQVENVPADRALEYATGEISTAERLGGSLPFYLEAWFTVVLLLVWILVPTLLGYWRFRSADLT
jgi:ABC-2 type transport system permease protein